MQIVVLNEKNLGLKRQICLSDILGGGGGRAGGRSKGDKV